MSFTKINFCTDLTLLEEETKGSINIAYHIAFEWTFKSGNKLNFSGEQTQFKIDIKNLNQKKVLIFQKGQKPQEGRLLNKHTQKQKLFSTLS